jgi:hypothetical protein
MGIANLYAKKPIEPDAEFFDDTTQEIYSAQTTLFLKIADLKYNQATFRPISTSIVKGDHFTYRQRLGYKVQDLGNDGTAAKPMFYTLPQYIGIYSGFYAYDPYFKDPLLFSYYDTKSPYTDGSVILARLGSYHFEVCHHRSFNKNWHLGACLETMLVDKEYIPTNIPGDRNVAAYAPFALLAHYKTDQHRYQVLASFYRKHHRVRETGGIFGKKGSTLDWLAPKAKIENNLYSQDSIETSELRQQYHLYQQFKIQDQLQAYHEIKLLNQFNQFKAPKLSAVSHYYLGGLPISKPESLEETTILQTLGNEWGFKGNIDRLFYRCYYSHKKLECQPIGYKNLKAFQEHYIGLQTRIKVDGHTNYLHMHGEYLWDGHYQLHTVYEGSLVELGYHQLRHKPSILAQNYQSHYRKWDKHFESPKNHQLYGAIRLALPRFMLKPYVRITKVENPIYFQNIPTKTNPDQQDKDQATQAPPLLIEPRQSQGHANLLYLGTDMNLTIFSHFHADNELIFTQKQGPCAGIFRLPQFLFNTRLYYAKTLYEGRLDLETGVDLHWHSPYMADGYDPATQQFHIQNEFKIYSYLLADLFFNFRINTFRGFIKLNYLNQHLAFMAGLPGYFVTPLYPGQSRSLDVGVSWSFFD